MVTAMPASILAALVLLFGLLLPPAAHPAGQAGVGRDNSISAKTGKARTVAELDRMYDSRHCGDCHEKQYRDWQASAHSESIMGVRRLGRKALAILQIFETARDRWPYSGLGGPSDIRVEHLTGCTRCHLPQLADAEDSVARELVADFLAWKDAMKNRDAKTADAIEAKLGGLTLNCLICHNRNAVVHKWTDGYPSKKTVYGTKDGPHFCGGFPFLKKSPAMGEPVLCGQCHGLGPQLDRDNPTQCPTAYGYYLFDYKSAGGDETCQDCHMRKNGLGHNIQSYRHPAMIDAALDFSTDISPVLSEDEDGRAPGTARRQVPRIEVAVEMTNRAGHPIPDGCPTVARLILEVTAKSDDGSEIFFEEKTYMPIAQSYGRGEMMGRGPFDKSSLIVDMGLMPLQKVTERYEIPVPEELFGGVGETAGGSRKEVEVGIRLVYLPYGTMRPSDTPFTWREVRKRVPLGDRE